MGILLMLALLTSGPRVFYPQPHEEDIYGTGKVLKIELPIPDSLRPAVTSIRLVRERNDGIVDTLEILPFYRVFSDNTVNYKYEYRYKVIALINGNAVFESDFSEFIKPQAKWFNPSRFSLLLSILLYVAILLYFISQAKAQKSLYLRPIAGLEAVNEAVGRATEMGRPIVYVCGLSSLSDVATIAALNILSHIAKRAGEYETRIIVPCYDPVVYTMAREIVKEAYTSIGRPDLFRGEDVYFATDSQFGYAAHVSALMVREQSATNFFMGYYFAESLILSETGASTGAIQVAGTDSVAQLPFFVVTCDYTLIGEELYAASAYLSKEPLLTGTIKGQDLSKLILGLLLVVVSIFGLFGVRLTLGLF
ncbi:MAG: DUF6754 domain-containing protein [candidate division WOR-3 bacterium]